MLKVTHYLLLLPVTKSNLLQLHISYLRNKVTLTYYKLLLCGNEFVIAVPTMFHLPRI